MNEQIVRSLVASALVATLSACSGAGGSLSSIPTGGDAGNVVQPTTASIVITIPKAASNDRSRPAYVSAGTRSIGGTIAPAAGCAACSSAQTVAANLTPTTNGCAPGTGGATVCTIPLVLKPGSYTASITTYDAINQGGNKLSSNQVVPFAITPNAANQVPMTLNGIPASLTLALSGTPPATLTAGALIIDGTGTTVTVSVTTKDADNNTIVGAGAPTLASANVTGNVSYATHVSSSAFTLTTPATGSRNPATITVNLAAPNCPGAAACSGSLTANISELVAVADFGLQDVKIYNERTQTFTSTTIALQHPENAIFDSKGNLWIADNFGNAVYEVAPPYTGAATTTVSNGIVGPLGIAFDSAGDLFVGNYGGGNVTEYAPSSYTGAPIVTLGSGLLEARGILVDSSDNLWVANDFNANAMSMYYPKPVSAATAITLPAKKCEGVTEYTPGSVLLSCLGGGGNGNNYEYSTSGAYVTNYGLNGAFMSVIPMPAAYGAGFIGVHGNVANASDVFASSTYTSGILGGVYVTGIATDENNTLWGAALGSGEVYTSTFPYTGITLAGGVFTSPDSVNIWP